MKYRILEFLRSVGTGSSLQIAEVNSAKAVAVSPELENGRCERFCGFKDRAIQPGNGSAIDCTKCYATEIVEGELIAKTGEHYPIKGGIPRLLSPSAADFLRKNKESFSLEWKYSRGGERNWGQDLEIRKELFLKAIGASPESLRGKLILDAGCGSGQLARAMADSYGMEVVAVDLANGVENAYAQNTNPQVHFVQGSVLELPLQSRLFDYVYCAGVLIHLPDTEKAFGLLPRLLKPGGRLFIWVYHQVSHHEQVSDRFRETLYQWVRGKFTSRLPIKLQEVLYLGMVVPFVLRRFLLGLINRSNDDRRWREKMQNLIDTFSPAYVNRHTEEEVLEWYRRNGLSNCTVAYRERYGFGVRGDFLVPDEDEPAEGTRARAVSALVSN